MEKKEIIEGFVELGLLTIEEINLYLKYKDLVFGFDESETKKTHLSFLKYYCDQIVSNSKSNKDSKNLHELLVGRLQLLSKKQEFIAENIEGITNEVDKALSQNKD